MLPLQSFTRSSIGQFEAKISGNWPDEISGYVFVAAPYHKAGERHLFGGTGVIIRWDLTPQNGSIKVDCEKIKTWDSYWQDALPVGWGQRAFFPARMSLLGIAETGNTGVVNMDGRLIFTADAGRYWEVDPVTLETITPVGYFDEHIISIPMSFFPMITNTAHPLYDPDNHLLISCELKSVPRIGQMFSDMVSSVYINIWDGKGTLKHWQLDGTTLDGSPHTAIVTEECVMIPDMPFQVGLTTLLGIDTSPAKAYPSTQLYIVNRKDLTNDNYTVPAKLVTFPGDSFHFACNYRHQDGNIHMVAVQQPTISLTEAIEPTDVNHFTGERFSPECWGIPWMFPFQPGVLRKVVIRDAELISTQTFIHPGWYATMLYATDPREQFTATGYSAIYQGYAGFYREFICRRYYLEFRDHPNRILSDDQLPKHNLPGILACLPTGLNWDEITEKIKAEYEANPDGDLANLGSDLLDFYVYPDGYIQDSIQFIPKGKGYIMTTVFAENLSEAWIFAADNLRNGPVAKLTLPAGVCFGFTLHSEYFETITPAPRQYQVNRLQCALRSLLSVPFEFFSGNKQKLFNR